MPFNISFFVIDITLLRDKRLMAYEPGTIYQAHKRMNIDHAWFSCHLKK